MKIQLFQRRTIWWPTAKGWLLALLLAGVPLGLWCWCGENFLAVTDRQPARILVIEGWIGIEGVTAAKAEFDRGGYDCVVATGGMSGNKWDTRRWSYAIEAYELLAKLGVPPAKLVLAEPADVPSHRTFVTAWAVRRALADHHLHPGPVNLFTHGVHARRSRLVFSKVLATDEPVGVIAWAPDGYFSDPWWGSSERALDLLKETLGYPFEAVLNSGRWGNAQP